MGVLMAALPAVAGAGAAEGGAASLLSTLGYVGAIGGAGVSALGAISGAASQQQAAEYRAQVAANNAQIAEQNAQSATAAGEQQAATQGMKTKANVGAIKAAQAASNIDVNKGSAVDVRSSAAELGELDALTIRSNAQKQALGYKTQEASFQGEQSLAQSEANYAPVAGALSATGSLLSGATSVGNMYTNWQRAAGPSVKPAFG